jgi:hypothetical protein
MVKEGLEQMLLQRLSELNEELQHKQRRIKEMKREVLLKESEYIELKIQHEKLTEELRVCRNTVPPVIPEKSLRDIEIERFRETYPEVCAEAEERDKNKE